MRIFRVIGFEITIELIISYLAKNAIGFKPFIKSYLRQNIKFRFLVDSNVNYSIYSCNSC